MMYYSSNTSVSVLSQQITTEDRYLLVIWNTHVVGNDKYVQCISKDYVSVPGFWSMI